MTATLKGVIHFDHAERRGAAMGSSLFPNQPLARLSSHKITDPRPLKYAILIKLLDFIKSIMFALP